MNLHILSTERATTQQSSRELCLPHLNSVKYLVVVTMFQFSHFLFQFSIFWHIPGLQMKLKKNIKLASANACKLCIPRENVHLLTHTDIHTQAKRALPENMCMYKHALMLYKLLRRDLCDNEMMHLNFQIADNERSTKMSFFKRQKYDVGKNVLLNRLHILNDKIEKNWINLKLDSFKIKCKELFLLAR